MLRNEVHRRLAISPFTSKYRLYLNMYHVLFEIQEEIALIISLFPRSRAGAPLLLS